MKNLTFNLKAVVLVIICAVTQLTLSAQTAADIFNTDMPITYLGIDFTQAKLINDPATSASDAKNTYGAINQLVLNEPKKFNFPKVLYRDSIIYDISVTNDRNKTISENDIASNNSADISRLDDKKIASMVKSYNLKGKSGVGMVFIMEAMDKSQVKAAIYIVFLNMKTKEVLAKCRVTEKPSGFGFRNYWASTIYQAMNDLKSPKYKEMQQEVTGSKK